MRHVVIGAGPAGLTIAWQLVRSGEEVVVLEADPHYVGGLSRTVAYKGHRFDIGGHRFYSKSGRINELWREMLPGEFIDVERLSRIHYDGRFFPYPLEVGPTLRTLGPRRSLRIGASYLRARLAPRHPEASFEDWIVNRFGRELYRTFFKTYTEKVWGMPCHEISKDFAAQRIRGLTFLGAATSRVRRWAGFGGTEVKTLIERFTYPRLGPGQLWEAVRDDVVARGGAVELGRRVVAVHHNGDAAVSVETAGGTQYEADVFYSTMTLRDLVAQLRPEPPREVRDAARHLRFRDFLTVAVIVDRPELFPDTWIYVHDPQVRVGRIQNYKNWSADMVGDPTVTCLGLEYFCNRGDPLWAMRDDDLVAMAGRELDALGLADAADCRDGCVLRVPDAYPVYDADYLRHRRTIRSWLAERATNVFPAGRGGLHNYNSQDHAMMTGLLSVRNALEGSDFDVWAINTEEEYAETGEASASLDRRLVPAPLGRSRPAPERPEPGAGQPAAAASTGAATGARRS
jgi:protoporphyrinogen oxidase